MHLFVSKKNNKTENGTAKEPITISPGMVLLLSNKYVQARSKKYVMIKTKNTLENTHGWGQVCGMSLVAGVVYFVPAINTFSPSSLECFLKTAEKRFPIFNSEFP